VLFQPAEERGTGAKAMIDDGLYDKHKIPVPDFVLGQHVMAMRAGSVGSKLGTIMAGADSMKTTLFGVGGHGSQVGGWRLHSLNCPRADLTYIATSDDRPCCHGGSRCSSPPDPHQ
jgi:hypothetical protein